MFPTPPLFAQTLSTPPPAPVPPSSPPLLNMLELAENFRRRLLMEYLAAIIGTADADDVAADEELLVGIF